MPPQQVDRLLDFVDEDFGFGAHLLPSQALFAWIRRGT
jgi:hypothetical protein